MTTDKKDDAVKAVGIVARIFRFIGALLTKQGVD
jgi:hypothetical protein